MTEITRLIWRAEETPAELHKLLESLGEEYPVSDHGRGLKLKFNRLADGGEPRLRVIRSRGEVTVEYNTITAAARGVGSALAGLSGEECSPFRTLGIMLDASRNMVMKPAHLRKWMRRLALSGCNLILLYCEDTYELEEYPFFGTHSVTSKIPNTWCWSIPKRPPNS